MFTDMLAHKRKMGQKWSDSPSIRARQSSLSLTSDCFPQWVLDKSGLHSETLPKNQTSKMNGRLIINKFQF